MLVMIIINRFIEVFTLAFSMTRHKNFKLHNVSCLHLSLSVHSADVTLSWADSEILMYNSCSEFNISNFLFLWFMITQHNETIIA
jgi:hypothetical protein